MLNNDSGSFDINLSSQVDEQRMYDTGSCVRASSEKIRSYRRTPSKRRLESRTIGGQEQQDHQIETQTRHPRICIQAKFPLPSKMNICISWASRVYIIGNCIQGLVGTTMRSKWRLAMNQDGGWSVRTTRSSASYGQSETQSRRVRTS